MIVYHYLLFATALCLHHNNSLPVDQFSLFFLGLFIPNANIALKHEENSCWPGHPAPVSAAVLFSDSPAEEERISLCARPIPDQQTKGAFNAMKNLINRFTSNTIYI